MEEGYMTTNNEKVREFYEKFRQGEFVPEAGTQASLKDDVISQQRLDLKMNLIAEEFFELVEAVYNKKAARELINAWYNIFDDHKDEPRNLDVVEAADATADLRYVIEGFDIEAAIPSERIFDEVHTSNLSKLGEDGEPVISDGVTPASDGKVKPLGKVIKGPNFFEPDIKSIIEGKTPDRTPLAKKK